MVEDICNKIETDSFYNKFLLSKNSENADVSKEICTLPVAEQITRLSQGLEQLSVEVQNRVRLQYNALLAQASHSSRLGSALEVVGCHVDALQAGADRLQSQVVGPCSTLEIQTRVLGRLHEASHVLRQISRFLQLFRRLNTFSEPVQQALILAELEPMCNDPTLMGLNIVREERSATISARQRILGAANRDLQGGLRNNSLPQIRGSVQIFANLNYLDKAMDDLLASMFADIRQLVRLALEGGLGSTSTVNLGTKAPGRTPIVSSQSYKTKLWLAVEKLFSEDLYGFCKQIQLLQQIIMENSLTLKTGDILVNFWKQLQTVLVNGFQNSTTRAWQSLELELPRLLGSARVLEGRLSCTLKFSNDLFKPFEEGFLKRCQATLNNCLQSADIPSQDMVDLLVRDATSELSAALVDQNLSISVGGIVSAANSTFWDLIENNIKRGPDAAQIVDTPNATQLTNITLANLVDYHGEQIRRLVTNLGSSLPSVIADRLIANLSKGEVLIQSILQPVIDSINTAISAILLSIHQESGLRNSTVSATNGPSLYMRELQQFINRVSVSHLASYTDHKTVAKCCRELSVRCVDQFVIHVSVVRPLSPAGRQKLKVDCSCLESALRPLIGNLSELGKPYRLLRCLATMLDTPPTEISLEGSLRASTILMSLFSHAGPELDSPHVVAGWNIEKLIKWLSGHTAERDRLEMIAGALQRYRSLVRQKNSTHYDPVYPLLCDLLDKAKAYQ